MSAFKNIFVNNLENQPEMLSKQTIERDSEDIYQNLLDDLLSRAHQPETTNWSVDLDDYVLSFLMTNRNYHRRNLRQDEKTAFYQAIVKHFNWAEDDFHLIKMPPYTSHEFPEFDAKSYEAYSSSIHYVENMMHDTHVDKIIWTHYRDILNYKLYFDWKYLAELHTKKN